METQPRLPLAEPSWPARAQPAPADHLFFATRPPADVAHHLRQLAWRLRERHGLQGWPRNASLLHVSLHGLGDALGRHPGLVARAVEAAAAVSMPPFAVAFDRVVSFRTGERRPLVLLGGDGVVGVMLLRQGLGEALAKAGFPWKTGGYTPHLTMLYDREAIAEEAVEPVRWTADRFVLVRSFVGEGRHVPLATWTLRG